MNIKPKKCVWCGDMFTPFKSTVRVCSPYCAIAYNKDKEVVKKVKSMAEGLKTHSDYLKMLQVIFNTFIRLRDEGKPCISCGCNMADRKGDASHFYSVGSYPNLRFNEDNVHLSCVPCNQHQHGNLLEYIKKLPARIGQSNFEALTDQRNIVYKPSIPELKELIQHYKEEVKEFKTTK